MKEQWCIPEVSTEFVAAMEDVLELYAEPYDAKRPKVNFDESSKQLIKESRQPLPVRPGQPPRYDYEYERGGTRNLFLFTEPQAGFRHVNVTEQRTMKDFAHQMKWLVDVAYPEAEVIRLVMDNLNTHKAASLYEAFACVFRGSVSKVFGAIVSKYFDIVSKVFVFSVSKFRPFPKFRLTLPKTLLTPTKS